jgi:hypothetical protein
VTLYVGACRRCGAQQMSFDVYGVSIVKETGVSIDDFTRDRTYFRVIELACRCPECSKTTLITLAAANGQSSQLPKLKFEQNENPTKLGYRELMSIPAKASLPTPADTPNPAAKFYEQGATAMAHDLYAAAGAMFRKCLESVTRTNALLEKFVPKGDWQSFRNARLKTRITKLKELHAIPPALGDLVDVIKEEGDEGVHEDQLYNKENAEALHRFTETFLEQTFTIPAQIARVREKKK